MFRVILASFALITSTLLVSDTVFTYKQNHHIFCFCEVNGGCYYNVLMYILFVMKTLVTNPAIIEDVARRIKVA